jgi:acyl-CoA synthetase (AMP-forming)/AMP-acid ligase II
LIHAPASLVDLLDRQVAERPDAKAFIFVPERGDAHLHLTYAELYHRVRGVAARLRQRTGKGDRALLLFPPGLEFVAAFFGCLLAGVIAVPLMVPRRTAARDSSAAIIADCSPEVALTTRELLKSRPDIAERFGGAGIDWLAVDVTEPAAVDHDVAVPRPQRDDLALLQYTSGSTSTPKGVMVAHDNLLANLEMIRVAMGNTQHQTSVGWVPLYHDMGLMMGAMQPLYLGGTSVLMAPAAFMQRPLNWLHIISRYRAAFACAPNFAYDLCVSRFRADQLEGVDLSCWKLALNGAEPVQADTIARFNAAFAPYRFDPAAMYAGYGLAEATLQVSGGARGGGTSTCKVSRAALQHGEIAEPTDAADAQAFVACGRSVVGQRLAIVDPATQRAVSAGKVGEIWASGPHIARGYWRNLEATDETFLARITGMPDRHWLRTGDLGFLDASGELFITGRIKDLIIIRGMNHYPQDIERTVQDSHPALRRDGGAAFAITDASGHERLVILQEVERTQRRSLDLPAAVAAIREAVTRQHEIAIETIALIPPATLPKTTSGKVQRSLAKQQWLEGGFDVLG